MANMYTNLVGSAALGLSIGIGSVYAPLRAQEVKDCGILTVVSVLTKGDPQTSWAQDTLPVSGMVKQDLDRLIGGDGYWESGDRFKAIVDGLKDMQYVNSNEPASGNTDNAPRKILSVRYNTGKCLF